MFGELVSYRVEPVAYRQINETTAGLDRIIGTVQTLHGQTQWAVFRKRLHRQRDATRDGTFAASEDQTHWNYWRRESEAYSSSLLQGLAPGLRAPTCYAQEAAGERIDLWLEYIPGIPAARWSIERFTLAMRHIGRFQGRFVSGEPMPDFSWLSQGHLRAWTPRPEHESSDTRYRRLLDARDDLLDVVEATPRTICHLDLRGANLFSGNQNETVLIDWSSAGFGALGEDVASAVFDSVWMNDVRSELLGALHDTAIGGYIEGLRDVGWMGDEEEVCRNYLIVAGLRFGLLAERTRRVSSDPEYLATLESRYGIAGKRVIEARIAVCDLALDGAETAMQDPRRRASEAARQADAPDRSDLL